MRTFIIILLFSNAGIAAKLTLNNAGAVGVTSSTIFSDTDIQVTFSAPRECCVGNSCQQQSGVVLDNPTNKPLKIALDGYEYDVNSNVQLIHSVNLISIASTPLRSCEKQTGGFPSVGAGQTNLSASNVYFGLSNVYLDVKNWRLTMRSIDQNLVCENGTIIPPEIDLIFYNGFELN